MTYAANRAAKPLTGASRNRPSHALSQPSRVVSGDTPSSSGDNGPLFLKDLQSQYESLSDKLARENAEQNIASSTPPILSSSGSGGGCDKQSRNKISRKVRWAETAAIASTIDATNDNHDDIVNDENMDVLSEIFQRRYTLPIALLVTTGIFLLVHFVGRPNPNSVVNNIPGHGTSNTVPSGAGEFGVLARSGSGQLSSIGYEGGYRDRDFGTTLSDSLSSSSFRPTTIDETLVPTIEVIHHTTPKISPLSGVSRTGGVDPDYIVIPTSSGTNPGGGEEDNGNRTTLKFTTGNGVPTPAPALKEPDAGLPTNLSWNYPPGIPTPDPALLIEMAPPDNRSPTNLKMKFPTRAPLGADTPNNLAKWNYPPGQPTPNPALFTDVTDKVDWGYPPGVPTPDPILLEGGVDAPEVQWGYPPGAPTPDPALLTSAVEEPVVTWGYPEGEPTPDPAFLKGNQLGSEAPTKGNIQAVQPLPTKKPTLYIVKGGPAVPSTAAPAWTMKVMDLNPTTPSPASMEDPDISILDLTPGSPRPVPPGSHSPPPAEGDVLPSDLNVQVWSPFKAPNLNADGQSDDRFPAWLLPYLNGQGGGGLGYPGVGGSVIPQCGCCCCQCSPAAVAPPLLPGAQDGQGMMQGAATQDRRLIQYSMATQHETPGCPWECLIDEMVPTKGRSNEDDALYEIFYTNPLNCCGTIVEVGAEDGMQFSASYFFEKGMNWTAHLIEADPLSYEQIVDNRNGEKVKATNGAFCNEAPFLYFDEESRTFQSVTKGDHSSEILSYDSFEITKSTTKVNCIRLDSELANVDHVNVLIVRVKGDPWAVIRTMNWNVRVDIWVILMEEKLGVKTLDTVRATLKLHDYVPASWDIKLWCDTPANCMENEVWLRKNFNPIHNPLVDHRGLRGSYGNFL